MIKSINMMKSERNNIVGHALANVLQFISCPTDIVRRATLMLALMMTVVGNVEAEERVVEDYEDKSDAIIPVSYFDGVLEGSVLSIHVSTQGQIYLATNDGYKKLWEDSDYNEYYGPNTKYYDSSTGNFKFELTEEILKNIIENNGLRCYSNWGGPIDKIVIELVVNDEFPGSLPAGIESKKQDIPLTVDKSSYAFDFSEVKTDGLQYARYYLLSGKKAQDITGKISINSGNGNTFSDNPSRGAYIYKNGAPLDDDDLKGILNISAKDLYGKTLVAVFSEKELDLVTPKEPELCAMYEYTFVVPETTITIYKKNNVSSYEFSIDNLPEKMGISLDELGKKFSIEWSVEKDNGDGTTTGQKFNQYNATSSEWYFSANNNSEPYEFSDYCIKMSEATNGVNFASDWSSKKINTPTIKCPTSGSGSFADFENCTVVCKATSSVGIVNYIFRFNEKGIEPDSFDGIYPEPDIKGDDILVTVAEETKEIVFSDEISGMKYARFYLRSKDGSLYEGNSEAITFDGMKATDVAKRGYYLYDADGLKLENLKVKVTLPKGTFYDYNLIAVFSDKVQTTETGTDDVIKETELSSRYVYDFVVEQISKETVRYVARKASSAEFSIADLETLTDGVTLNDMEKQYSIMWYVQDAENVKQSFDNSWGFSTYDATKPYCKSDDNLQMELNQSSTFDGGGSLENKWSEYKICNPTISCPSGKLFKNFKDYSVVCMVETVTHKIKYKFLFTRNGEEPDAFEGDFDDNQTIEYTKEVAFTETTVSLDFSKELDDTELFTPKYGRFYLEDKNTEELFADNKNVISVKDGKLTDVEKRGYYLYNESGLTPEALKLVVENMLNGQFYGYNLVALFSDEAPVMTGETITHDAVIKKKFVYSFIPKEGSSMFIHSKGVTGRNYITHADDPRILETTEVKQYSWNGNVKDMYADVQETNSDVRQGVHTMEYDVYVNHDPQKWDNTYILYLPIQYYEGGAHELEPSAYIRWYDWKTDMNHEKLVKKGSRLEELNDAEGVSRGWFFLNKKSDVRPAVGNVGVNFDASDFPKDGEVVIACDVSRYSDGIKEETDGKYTLLHEPTIGTRYIFTIRHAKVIADKIALGKQKFESKDAKTMFKLAEDNGRFCVSYYKRDDKESKNTKFSVRSFCPRLTDYYMYNGAEIVQCSNLRWKAYYEDGSGIWEGDWLGEASGDRIQTFEIAKLDGTYKLISNPEETKTIKAENGMRFHVVGYLENDGVSAPAIHYEMNLLYAPAFHGGNIPLERTRAYLEKNMERRAVLDFDDMFKDEEGNLSTDVGTQRENHTDIPLPWNEASYGFCYPQLDDVRVNTASYTGLSPYHGDYIFLKTMNVEHVSESGKTGSEYPYKYCWFEKSVKLEDYTYRFGGEHKYGGFLYVDASDESRTIAKLNFDAELCDGADLCYTAVVADMTTGDTTPHLMTSLYAVKNDGTKTHVASFLSCDLADVAVGGLIKGKWYQVYGKISVPVGFGINNYDHFEVAVDNYATNTNGADYCVDQIMFFTNNAKLKVSQNPASCDEENVEINAYIDADVVKEIYKGETLYWRVMDEKGNLVKNIGGLYGLGGEDELKYGLVNVPDAIPVDIPNYTNLLDGKDSFAGYFMDQDGKLCFSFINKAMPLLKGKKYYFSVYTLGETPVEVSDAGWGHPDNKCSVYSPVFVPRKMYLSLLDGDGNVQTTIHTACSGTGEIDVNLEAVVNVPDEDVLGGFKTYHDVHFDFYMGKLEDYDKINKTINIDGTETKVYLSDALKYYRGKDLTDETVYENWSYKDAKSLDETAFKNGSDYIDDRRKAYFELLNKVVNTDKMLYLDCSNKFEHSMSAEKGVISALPIENYVTKIYKETNPSTGVETEKTQKIDICTPLEFSFTIDASAGGPTLQLGFENVEYPDGYVRVVRLGKEQMDNLQNYMYLHVPVNTFNTNSAGNAESNKGTVAIVGNLELLKEGTTDPTVTGNVENVATFVSSESYSFPAVSSDRMYVSLNFDGENVTKQTFREGFAYRMFFQVANVKEDGTVDENGCKGNVEFLLKIVPEFVTWTGNAGDLNTNWNNDGNWTRSKCEELYKTNEQNSPTAAHLKYSDNDNTLGQPDTYVPMKFTYVTMPSQNRAPNLINLTTGGNGIYNNIGDDATANIQYDMMVRTEEKCMDEKHEENGTILIYDCEKFYGNCCKEIYFKPEAELVNQQHLVYEKAWVEKELVPAAWYLMSSPLRSVCSGDMYVPQSNGRQDTEAFQEIKFGDMDNTFNNRYSRTKYPIYQRSWKLDGAYVYTENEDWESYEDPWYKTYSANLLYSNVVEKTMAQWSHVYNDVAVADTTLTGFSIRAHKELQEQKALLRLPKDDCLYEYYLWNNNVGNAGSWSINKYPDSHGRLKTEGSVDGLLKSPISLIQVNNGYALIGNPYMSSVKMSEFFDTNSDLIDKRSFWTYDVNDDGTSTKLNAHGGSGTIRPMQAFFVKLKDDVAETDEITFNPEMMIDGNTSPETEAAAAGVRMTAANNKGQSSAVVAYVDGASNGFDGGEDVETFFDSNFSDVPMVYTVAGTKAVSINTVPKIDIVPFGVTCTDNDAVDVTITGTDMTAQQLYVYDAANGTCAEIRDGEPISVQPNDYGRYYLTTRSSMNLDENIAQGFVVSVRDGKVTVTSAENISRVVVTALNGANLLGLANCGLSATFTLHPGVYVIEMEGDAGKKTVKVMVK